MRIGHLLRRSARHHRDHPAVTDAFGTRTFGEIDERVARLARGLRAGGIGRGDRIAVVAKNRCETIELYLAAAELSAVTVPLNWRLRPQELAGLVADSTARIVVADEEFASALDTHAEAWPQAQRFVYGPASAGWSAWDELYGARAKHLAAGAATSVASSDESPEDGEIAIQMYTSGTTGAAKGAMLSHKNVTAMVGSWLLEMPLEPRTSRFLQVTPLFHVGAMLMAMSNLAAGSQLHLHPEFFPGPALDALSAHRITHALFVPSMIQWILAEPGIETQRFPDLGLLVYGASPISPSVLARAIDVFGCGFLQGYGLTETTGVLTTLRPEDHRDDDPVRLRTRLTSAGRAVSCCEVRVVDATGREVAPGEVGEIVARGDNVTPGYWKNEQTTREALRNGWFHTGDLATIDDEGYVTIVDRLKDMILVGGENVYPREIEDVLRTHPAVQDAAVIGIPHDVWGEEVLALVVARATVDERTLVRHCRDRLARFKCPTKVEFRDEIPRNAAGKALKKELRDPYWANRARRV